MGSNGVHAYQVPCDVEHLHLDWFAHFEGSVTIPQYQVKHVVLLV